MTPMQQPYMHIALASDCNYLPLVEVCLLSLFHTNIESRFHIHLLANGPTEDDLSFIRQTVEANKSRLSVYPIRNLRERLSVDVPPSLAVTSYARLFIASILPPEVDRVLYIDCDVMFASEISSLQDVNMGKALMGGIIDPLLNILYKKEIGIPVHEPYLNAGILLINTKQWRLENIERKFIDFLLAHHGNVHHHDQGIINAVCCGRKKILPPRFNVMSNCFCYPWKNLRKINRPYYSREEFEEAIENPAIIHFTGNIHGRPWTTLCEHPYKDNYLEYRAQTRTGNNPLAPASRSAEGKLEYIVFKHAPFSIYRLIVSMIHTLSFLRHRLKS